MCIFTVCVHIWCVCLVCVWMVDWLHSESLWADGNQQLPVCFQSWRAAGWGGPRQARKALGSFSICHVLRGSIYISLSVHLFLKFSHSSINPSGSHQTIRRFPPKWSTWSQENMCWLLQMLAADIRVLYLLISFWTTDCICSANTTRPGRLVIVWSDQKIYPNTA